MCHAAASHVYLWPCCRCTKRKKGSNNKWHMQVGVLHAACRQIAQCCAVHVYSTDIYEGKQGKTHVASRSKGITGESFVSIIAPTKVHVFHVCFRMDALLLLDEALLADAAIKLDCMPIVPEERPVRFPLHRGAASGQSGTVSVHILEGHCWLFASACLLWMRPPFCIDVV